MGEVTALQVRGDQVDVFIDGSFSFRISAELVDRKRLGLGQVLSPEEIGELIEADVTERCFNAALRLLSYRSRSRAELKQRLLRRGFSEISVDKVITVLEQNGLVDDASFAQYWVENRLRFKPKSARLINLELRYKGVAAEVADRATEDLDEESLAYQAALRKARLFADLTEGEFRSRLYHYLRRRGFGHMVISCVLQRLQEKFGDVDRTKGDPGVSEGK